MIMKSFLVLFHALSHYCVCVCGVPGAVLGVGGEDKERNAVLVFQGLRGLGEELKGRIR